ncbi:MAG: hypothetical protein ACRCTZ_20480 [Sarcina sp.]
MEVREYIKPYVSLDKPVEYKNLKIHPIYLNDFLEFSDGVEILNIDKNSIPDVNIIKMTYLEFIMNLIISDINGFREKFYKVVEYCFHKKRVKVEEGREVLIDDSNEGYDVLMFNVFKGLEYKFTTDREPFLIIDGIELDARSFDEIVKIIMFQNFVDYDDSVMDKDFKEALDEYYRIKNKGIIAPDIEEKRDVILLYKSSDEINKMTYRRFQRIFSLIVEEKEYTIAKQAELFGTKFEKGIDHWIYKKQKDKYADAFASADNFKNKLSSVTG